MPHQSSPYESGPLREITGVTIRPGGLTLTDRALDFCRFTPGAQLLDVGCGAGATVEHLSRHYGFVARGVDLSQLMIAEGLGRNPSLSLTVAAAESLPCAADSMNGLLCECVLSLLDEPCVALAEFYRVLHNGGYLILSDMYDRNPADGVGTAARPRGMESRWQVETWLAESGFVTQVWEDHTPLLRELAAHLILAHGSLEGLCCSAGSAGQRPGYYLLVARKQRD